ncbi:MAG: pyridoxal phosphate-dependent aminotransferase [Muribaculaceae bacterium]|nr:pyridoxal phosphate-dependent aminotransferase [Muribaculaceae bacterium]
MEHYDFSKVVDRRGTSTYKYGALEQVFGRDDVLPLWVADMDFEVCPAITQAIARRICDHPVYGYTMPPESFWQAIIDWQRERNNFCFTRDDVCFVGGIVYGFALVVNHFTRPGDKVVIQQPVYHPFNNILQAGGRQVVNNALRRTPDGFYRMDLEDLERIFAQQHPRLMVVCNPHNPIGIAWDADTLREVARLARQYGVLLFSDEIHGDLMLFGHRHTPLATVSDDAAAMTITMGAPSKTFNIAGLKSSWCVVLNPELRQPFFQWMEQNELSSPHLVALVATEAAYRHGHEWLDQCLCYIEGNITMVENYCSEHIPGVRAIRPQASFLQWLDCTALGLSHDQLIDLFVDKAQLALNDGAMFGPAGSGFMRLNVGTARPILEQAMSRLAQALRQD